MSNFEELELRADDGVRMVSLALGMSIFVEAPLTSVAAGILLIYERFLSETGIGALQYYSTETMRKHKPITKSTFSMLPTWLSPNAPQREYVSIYLKDGDQHQDAPHRKFEVHGFEPKNKLFRTGRANVLSISFPANQGKVELLRMKDIFVQACTVLPVRSGIAGLTLECSRYDSETSETYAWSTGMRMRGLDICRIPIDCQAVGLDGLRGVGWLTALGNPQIERLGGLSQLRKGLSDEISLIETSHGVVIQAGGEPQLGDVNRAETLSLYRSVYKKLAPLIDIAAQRTIAFDIEEDYVAKTRQWYLRLNDA